MFFEEVSSVPEKMRNTDSRPTQTRGAAMGALNFLTASGLFMGQSPAFFILMNQLAQAADAARRGGH
jgi:hypothetical protein